MKDLKKYILKDVAWFLIFILAIIVLFILFAQILITSNAAWIVSNVILGLTILPFALYHAVLPKKYSTGQLLTSYLRPLQIVFTLPFALFAIFIVYYLIQATPPNPIQYIIGIIIISLVLTVSITTYLLLIKYAVKLGKKKLSKSENIKLLIIGLISLSISTLGYYVIYRLVAEFLKAAVPGMQVPSA